MNKLILIVLMLTSLSIQAQKDQDKPTENKDQVIIDDQIVQGSECVGLDCVNGENFGFDTGRYKENNLRLHFDDTSSSASFPGNDWRITINDSDNGGASHFSVDDATAGTNPFRVTAGAGNHALFISNNGGNVGLGTNAPVVELHVTDGDSPAIRIEQNGASGWTPQTWDIAGNESNFFIRDVTNGSTLPFKIFPGAPNDALTIGANGIGIGTKSPTNKLDVMGDVGISGQIFGLSDARLKVNISSIANAMEIIKALDGKSYLFNTEKFPHANLPQGSHYGLLAQDVELVVDGLVKENNMNLSSEEGETEYYKGVNYQEFIPILINALKEQDSKIGEYEVKQVQLEEKQLELEGQLMELAKQLEELKGK